MSDENNKTELDLPPWGRVLVRIIFREGPMVILAFLMAGVILGIIPSPYLGDKLDSLRRVHDDQIVALREVRDELRTLNRNWAEWKNGGYKQGDHK